MSDRVASEVSRMSEALNERIPHPRRERSVTLINGHLEMLLLYKIRRGEGQGNRKSDL